MHSLFITDDLMITSQVGGAAEANGYELEFVRTEEQITKAMSARHVALVILDLQVRSLDVPGIVSQVKSSSPETRVVAFGPHVKVALLQAAQDAGCDQIMSRGEFTRRLNDVFQAQL